MRELRFRGKVVGEVTSLSVTRTNGMYEPSLEMEAVCLEWNTAMQMALEEGSLDLVDPRDEKLAGVTELPRLAELSREDLVRLAFDRYAELLVHRKKGVDDAKALGEAKRRAYAAEQQLVRLRRELVEKQVGAWTLDEEDPIRE